MKTEKPLLKGLIPIILGAFLSGIIASFFVNYNISTELKARNIEDIPELKIRLSSLESQTQRYREYLISLYDEVNDNKVDINTLKTKMTLIFENYPSR